MTLLAADILHDLHEAPDLQERCLNLQLLSQASNLPKKARYEIDGDNSNVLVLLSPGTAWKDTLTLDEYDMSATGLYRITVRMSPRQFLVRKLGVPDQVITGSPIKNEATFQSNTITIDHTNQD